MIIREYHHNDLESLSELMIDLCYPTSLERLKKRLNKISGNSMYCTFVAEINHKVVGMIGIRQLYAYENDHMVTQISALVTKKEYRGLIQ